MEKHLTLPGKHIHINFNIDSYVANGMKNVCRKSKGKTGGECDDDDDDDIFFCSYTSLHIQFSSSHYGVSKMR
jgi:hypothetical protein